MFYYAKGNKKPCIPIEHAMHCKESYETTHMKAPDLLLKYYENELILCNTAVRSLKMLNGVGTLGENQHITKWLAMVSKLQVLRIIGYGEPKKTTHKVKELDSKSAFNSLIRTGVIRNLEHIDRKAN